MAIFGFAVAAVGAAGIWGIDRYRRNSTQLVRVLARGSQLSAIEQAKTDIQALLKPMDDRYQMAIHNSIDRMFGASYEKHLKALGGTTGIDAVPEMVKVRNRQAGYAGISFVLYLTGLPLLMVTAFAINLYLGYIVIDIGIRDMIEKRTLTARGRNTIVFLGVMLSGYLAVLSAAMMFWLLIEKFIDTVQGQSHERLVNVFGALPQTVWRIKDDVVAECPLGEVQADDVLVVYAGGVIPVDGEIIDGFASVDQHALTGEAQPVEKEIGDSVFASTLVLMGEIRVQVALANQETLAAQITEILNNTQSHNTQVGLRGVEIADRAVFATTAIGLLALPIWGVSSMLAVWSVELGSMLMATTPLSLLAYLDMSARSNILVKDGRSLELMSSIDTVVFDKTGTLTLDQPTVCGVYICGDLSEDNLLALAAAVEQHQSHPIAAAIRKAAETAGLTLPAVDETSVDVGYGLAVIFEGQRVQLGSQRYMGLSDIVIPDNIAQLASEGQALGHSVVYLATDGLLQGAIELQPTVRPEAKAVVDALHHRGIELAMITGDQEAPAQALAVTLGIDRVFANVLPEQKANLVRELQEQDKQVMFVGDGINDSIALKQAQVSVSIAGATTVATDTAQIVLMDGTLMQLDTLFDLVERYEKDLKKQYFMGIHLPAAYIAGTLLFGWGIASAYVVGYGVFATAYGLAFRPIWRQERIESRLALEG
ncbi:MAG: heavy metal translocating P-type ATPase [Chloroflexota bacterium]